MVVPLALTVGTRVLAGKFSPIFSFPTASDRPRNPRARSGQHSESASAETAERPPASQQQQQLAGTRHTSEHAELILLGTVDPAAAQCEVKKNFPAPVGKPEMWRKIVQNGIVGERDSIVIE